MVLFFGLFFEIGRFSRALKMSAPTRYDEMQSESRWRFPHQSEDWFLNDTLFGAHAHLYKFLFVVLPGGFL